VKAHQWTAAYTRCEAEYAASGSPDAAFGAASAALRTRKLDEGIKLVTPFLTGPRAADAYGLLGALDLQRDDLQHALVHLRIASALHEFDGKPASRSRDEHQLAGALFHLGEFALALEAEHRARDAAQRASDHGMQVFVDIAHADILRGIGDLASAEAAVVSAVEAAVEPDDRVLANLKLGIVLNERGNWGGAAKPLSEALALEHELKDSNVQLLESLYLNIAYCERMAGRYTLALAAIEDALRAGTDVLSYRLNRGLVLSEMGRHDEAIADLEAAEAGNPTGQWSWRVPFQRAVVEARAGHLERAILADRRAITRVAELAAKSGRFGPTVIASHRGPHLHLVGVLASQQRWQDVLEVVATMDAQSLLDSQEASGVLGPSAVGNVAVIAAPPRPAFAVESAASILDAWRGRRLVIIVPGGSRIWRLVLVDGTIAAEDLGEATSLEAKAVKLEQSLADTKLARALATKLGIELGELMLPTNLGDGGRVELLVVGPLARAPLAALRIGGALAVTRWHLVRASGVVPRTPPPARGPDAPVIAIGDPQGDLPEAAREATDVASRFAGKAFVGALATRASLARASGAKVLHIAAHTTQQFNGSILHLADGDATVADVASLAAPPRLVVLATCAGSAGQDDAGHGSFALAFIDAGADAVVATRWSVSDAGSAKLIEAFYAAGGELHPARALASAQASFADELPPKVWAAFEVITARPVRR